MHPLLHPIWWLKISKALGHQDHERVVVLSMRVLRKKPGNIAALRLAARSLESLGEFGRAKQFVRRALAVNPGDFDLRCALVRMLNPVEDSEELLEQAKWMVALSETVLPQDDLWYEKAGNTLERIPISTKLVNAAQQDFKQRRQGNKAYLRWAEDFIASQDALHG